MPYLLVAGDREVESRTVSVRTQEGADLGVMSIGDYIEFMHVEIARRSRIE